MSLKFINLLFLWLSCAVFLHAHTNTHPVTRLVPLSVNVFMCACVWVMRPVANCRQIALPHTIIPVFLMFNFTSWLPAEFSAAIPLPPPPGRLIRLLTLSLLRIHNELALTNRGVDFINHALVCSSFSLSFPVSLSLSIKVAEPILNVECLETFSPSKLFPV